LDTATNLKDENRAKLNNPIVIDDFSFSYAGANSPAVENISLTIERGEIVALVGHSGCGKSTLLRSLNGLIPHMYQGKKTGKVIIDGIDTDGASIADLAKRVGFVFQNPENQIFMFSVERDVGFGLENLGFPKEAIKTRVRFVLSQLGILDLAPRAPHELSDGQKQRVALAGVLAMQPSILVLDEPTSLLDPFTAKELIRMVARLNEQFGLTVIIVEHRLDLVLPIASRLVVMNRGRVIKDGPPGALLRDEAVRLSGVTLPTISRLDLILREKISLDQRKAIGEPVALSPTELISKMNLWK
jgi:energy-coupling factor transporter ATP-binding protein EcfA2